VWAATYYHASPYTSEQRVTASSTAERLVAAREAAGEHVWPRAFELLTELDREGALDGEGLQLLGEMAWWVHQPDVTTSARERAYTAYLAEGEQVRAALMALMAGQEHMQHRAEVVAHGWFSRARRILADLPESVAHGYLKFMDAMGASDMHDFDQAVELAEQAVQIGTRFGDKDLQGFALVVQGGSLVRRGDIDAGLSLLDEATAAAVAGELSPYATGVVYCYTISTCRDLADYRRAGQWTEVAQRWCERQSITGFPGVCRIHRAEILALQGDWVAAEFDLRNASQELLAFKASFQAAEGFYTLGEIRLRMGDLQGADEAFRQAQDLGREPQPGRALLYLANGRIDSALTSIQRAREDAKGNRLALAKVLPPYVEIALEAGRREDAAGAASELAQIAEEFGSPAFQAAAHMTEGLVQIAANEPDAALRELASARSHWQAVEAPYELARTRGAIAHALQLRGELDEAALEAETAVAAFARLGARLEQSRCQKLLDALRGSEEQGVRQRRTFMFTDIVGSTELMSVIGDEAWSDLKRYHDSTLRSLATTHGGEEINEAGDGFFFAFESVPAAVSAAVAVQRALAEHRRSAGFAPRVRIGLHATEATRVAESYVGQGVHQAARIGAIAGANEIVASAETLLGETFEGFAGPSRGVELKGIPGTVDVQTIEWSSPATS